MGALFRLLYQYTGLSQMRIATAVGLGQGRISEVINGTRAIGHTRVFERIADGLDMPDHARTLLGLSPRQITARPRPRSITPARPGQDTELLRQITAARSIDGTVVRVLQGETDNIRLLDRRLGAPAVAGKLEAHISHIETGLRYSLRPGNREQLARVLADASALAGWQAVDMGRLPRAWEHFERATAAAREAGDACLLAFAAGEQAYVLATTGHGTTEVADSARAYAAAVALALEEDREADKPKPIDAQAVDPAIATFTRYVHTVEVGLAEEALSESFKGIGGNGHELFEQPLFPGWFFCWFVIRLAAILRGAVLADLAEFVQVVCPKFKDAVSTANIGD
jgi:transcriptional regulator with XRE-family HTH domain